MRSSEDEARVLLLQGARMWGAGIGMPHGAVGLLDLPLPGPLAPDEVLVSVKAAGVGNWDQAVRMGGWDVGIGPPMALGVEAAGVVLEVGSQAGLVTVGDAVLTHPVPLRHQGTWAPYLVAPASSLALKPPTMSWAVAAAFPVPALTACQVIDDVLQVAQQDTLLVHGAGGVTGRLLVELALARGARVLATAGGHSARRLLSMGAIEVFDHHDAGWVHDVGSAAAAGVSAAVNAVPGRASDLLPLLRDRGRLATITSDAPPAERGIDVRAVYVASSGLQLAAMAELWTSGALTFDPPHIHPLARASEALLDIAWAARPGPAVLQVQADDVALA